MNNISKYGLLFSSYFIVSIAMFYVTSLLRDTNIDFQKSILVKQAQTHFKDQINNRKWNAQYGGVYVKPLKDQKPNPYLKGNILKVDDNLTLIKINPAWMTRQLSETLDVKNFHFRITSLNPINKDNTADSFETKALKYIEEKNVLEYYEITDNKNFRYMGALITRASCIPCHKHQGYKVGDVRGGISITLNTKNYHKVLNYIQNKVLMVRIIIFLLLTSITVLVYKQLRNNEQLYKEVNRRTKEIKSTKKLMQKVLDADRDFLFLTDKVKVIFTNKTVLDFAGYSSVEELNKYFGDIATKFEHVDDEDFLKSSYEETHWIDYLYEEQKNRNLKVLIINNGLKMYFNAHAKKIIIENETLYLISFSIITKEYEEIQALEEKASLDHLTGLLNRGKIDEILTQEMQLSNTVSSPLSIIFLDIDHFKKVNDTLGHEVGDAVLIELSELLSSLTRKGDFVSRWGGEEFLITLQSTTKEEATTLAEKIRKSIASHTFDEAGAITISLGVTQFIHNENKASFIRRVDEALYDAKGGGRNQVVVN